MKGINAKLSNSFRRARKLPWGLRFCAVSLFLCGTLNGAAEIGLNQWVHKQWQTDQNLPQSSVYCLAQDKDGFLWFGTDGGLVRFDGSEFQPFYRQNPPTHHNEFVSSLIVAQDGSLWAGTKTGGLVRYRNERFETPFPELNGDGVLALAEDKQGAIWIGTGHGVARSEKGVLTRIDTSSVFTGGSITALCAAKDGSVWIGNNAGELAQMTGSQLQQILNPHTTLNNSITAIVEDPRDGKIYIATDGEGVWSLQDGQFSRLRLTGKEVEYVVALLLAGDGAIWCGTDHDGLLRFKDGKTSSFKAQDGLNTDSVLCLLQDRDRSVWVGTLFGGLHRMSRGAFLTYGQREGLPADTVNCVLEREPGLLWLGTKEEGLFQRSASGFEAIATPGLSREIRTMLRTKENDIWVGAKDGGLVIFKNNGSTAQLTFADGLAANDVSALFQASDDSIWIGSQKRGVSVASPGGKVVRTITDPDVLCYIRCFAQDTAGTIWIGTQNGLVRSSGMAGLEHIDLGAASNASIRSILPDGADRLWIGTRDDGLLFYSQGKVFHFEPHHGLVQPRIYQLLREKEKLWIAGGRGIEKVAMADLEAVLEGRAQRLNVRFYTERDGLRTAECGGDSNPSAVVASDGSVWFGTRRGLATLVNDGAETVHMPPKVLIDKVRVDSTVLSARAFQRVPPGTARLQFTYTAPALANESRFQFSYMLDSIDKDWVAGGREREAVYNHLAPGEYRFGVRASDGIAPGSESTTTLAFTVLPQFYQTGWFYSLAALLGVGGVRGLYRWRVAGIQKTNRRLEELVQARTRELEKEVVHRKLAEEKQIALNSALETRVRARTAELTEAYDHLQGELRERERVEEELATSEAKFRRVVESGMVGILFWNRDGRIVEANDTFLRMSGHSREELAAGKVHWSRLTPPEHAHKDALALEQIERSGVCAPFEKEYIRKDGTRFPVLIGGASLKRGADEGVCFVLDISERIASEEKVRQLAQSLEERVHERTAELGRINEQLAAEVQERKRVAVALSAFSQLGQKLHSSRTEKEAANVIALTAKSLIPHDVCTIELYSSDHKIYPVVTGTAESVAEPILSSISVSIRNGTRVIGVISLKSTGRDAFRPSDASSLRALGDYCGGALDRIHAEEARRESERRFVAFMANAPALAWMKDSEFRYVFSNRMFQEFTGLEPLEIEGRIDKQLWPEPIASRIRSNDEQVLERDSTIQTQEAFRNAEGETRTFLTFRFPFTTVGGERFIAGMAVDITAQKTFEDALHRLPQAILEAQEQERRRLARELHDGVNQAIASAKFRIQTAESQFLRGDGKWQESCKKSKEMLDSVLQQVRQLSHNLRPGELDDLGLLAAARTAFEEFEDRTGIQVHFAVTGAEERLDPAVESTFYRVIQEALTNIERHSGASAVDIHLTENLSGVTLEISDNGTGFASSRDHDGLGLLHMRERANLVGGEFTLETEPAQGVRICLHVPKRR